jgi:hypothetical protein
MTPEHKFHYYVTIATIVVMYLFIKHIAPAFSDYALAAPIITLFTTVGSYNLFAKILASMAKHWLWVKQHLLGESFLNGTWVGEFYSNGEKVITIEVFEQSLTSLVIRGEAFTESGKTYARWTSKSASINKIEGSLTYHYTCDKDNCNATFQGICVFQFDRVDEKSPPSSLKGYSVDVTDGKRTNNKELKISNKLLTYEEALLLISNDN